MSRFTGSYVIMMCAALISAGCSTEPLDQAVDESVGVDMQSNHHPTPDMSVAVSDPEGDDMMEEAVEQSMRSTGCEQPLSAQLIPGESVALSTMIDGRSRSWLLRVPQGYDHTRPHPVLMILHGGLGSGAFMQDVTRFNPIADREGIVLIYPDGVAQYPRAEGDQRKLRTWNAGSCCGHARSEDVDDVRALVRVLDETFERACIDTSRPYLTGFSNGAMMTYRLAIEAGHRFAAIAPGGASPVLGPYDITHPVPLFHFHGLKDENAPFDGGMGCGPGDTSGLQPVPATLNQWYDAFACSEGADLVVLETDDVVCTTKRGCEELVQLCVLPEGNHTWPGGAPREIASPNCPKGTQIDSFNTNEAMWRFLSRHKI